MTIEQINSKNPKAKKILVFLLGLIIMGSAIATARYWIKNKPRAKKKTETVKVIPMVETISLSPISHTIIVEAMGNVVPAKQINLVSQVRGEVLTVNKNYIPGGFVTKGETVVTIDPLDYKLVKLQKQSDVEKAQNDLSVERGKQSVAKKEYKLLGADLAVKDQELILRKPQLRLTKANLAAAKARLKQAEVDLSRTKVKAPFNALIQSKQADIGSWQNTGASLASLIGTDQYWLEVNIAIDRLRLLKIPGFNDEIGSEVTLHYPYAWGEKTRIALIKRLKPNIDSKVRMAKLIIEVDDPLSFKDNNSHLPKLLMGAFIQVKISAQNLSDVLAVPRKALRNGEQLWLIVDSKLQIVDVKPLWKNKNFVYVNADNILPESQIITSDLSTPIVAMQLSLAKDE